MTKTKFTLRLRPNSNKFHVKQERYFMNWRTVAPKIFLWMRKKIVRICIKNCLCREMQQDWNFQKHAPLIYCTVSYKHNYTNVSTTTYTIWFYSRRQIYTFLVYILFPLLEIYVGVWMGFQLRSPHSKQSMDVLELFILNLWHPIRDKCVISEQDLPTHLGVVPTSSKKIHYTFCYFSINRFTGLCYF